LRKYPSVEVVGVKSKQAGIAMRNENCNMIRNTFERLVCRIIQFLKNMLRPKQGQLIVIRRDGKKSVKNVRLDDQFDSILKILMMVVLIFLMTLVLQGFTFAGGGSSLDMPVKGYGLSIGNSANFTGLRINFRDRHVEKINGINITLWPAKDNKFAEVNGLSLGILPEAGAMRGAGAEKEMTGLNLGVIGIGSGGDLTGINIGGIGAGSGSNAKGITVGLIGAGAGGSMTGINIGGIGVGAGGNLSGISLGLIGAGSGGNVNGITIGGIGAGAGKNMTGFNFGGIGVGAGENVTGITIGGIGAGAGNKLTGITIGGIGAGAPNVRGLTIGGIGAGGVDVRGVTLALANVRVVEDGQLSGFSASAFNWIRGRQSGVSLGVVNYAYRLNGFQIGLINYVKENPKGLKILPLINFHFD